MIGLFILAYLWTLRNITFVFLYFADTPPPTCSILTTTTYGSCQPGQEVPIAPISEERASRTLSRIKLLNRIRNFMVSHEQLETRLALCQRGTDLPDWWIPGRHDGELLRAAGK